jgi:hypothetical protein
MVRASFVISAACVLILAGFAQADSPFNVDVFWGWDYCYRPMEWTPAFQRGRLLGMGLLLPPDGMDPRRCRHQQHAYRAL